MFWIALAALIMSLTGEGDDTYAFRKVLERARDSVEETVHDSARQKAALQVLDRTSAAFVKHRERVGVISACIERADRKYAVTEAEYQRCLADLGPAWDAASKDLVTAERDLRASLTPEELVLAQRAAEQ